MEKSLMILWIVGFPGLLSASCSYSSHSSATVEYPSKFGYPPNSGSPIEARRSRTTPSSIGSSSSREECRNGWCSQDGECVCNPCWTGPTCQDYVDRFAPRFLAEEPFFILDASTASLASASATAGAAPAKSTSSPPSFSAAAANLTEADPDNKAKKTSLDSSSKPRIVKYDGLDPNSSSSPVPLFRIESADDDLGLTCQLGQVGPAATCPCATPRYKVIDAATTFPTLRTHFMDFAQTNGEFTPRIATKPQQNPNANRKTQTRLMFRADDETGDVFLQDGFTLLPSTYYFITLQVTALAVNSSGYRPWKEDVLAVLYIKSPPDEPEKSLEPIINQEDVETASSKENSLKFGTPNSSPSPGTSAQTYVNSHENRLKSAANTGNQLPYSFPSFKSNFKWKAEINRNKDQVLVEGKPFQRLKRHVNENANLLVKNSLFETSKVELFLSHQKEPTNSAKMQSGDKIKMQLLILLHTKQSPLDLDVEISALNDEKRDVYCSILTTNVTMLSSMDFENLATNFTPIMKKSNKNSKGADSALWHFKSVRSRGESHNNNGIMIEFDLLATKRGGGTNHRGKVCNSSSLCPTSSSLSPVSLSFSQSSSPSSSSSSSQPPSHSDLIPPKLNTMTDSPPTPPLLPVTKGFHKYLIPIQARASFHPTGHDQNHNDNPDDYDKSTFPNHVREVFPARFLVSPLVSDHDFHANKTNTENKDEKISLAFENENVTTKPSDNVNSKTQTNTIQMEIQGPHEIQQGEWETFSIKVYYNFHIEGFRLTLKPNTWNKSSNQDAISVGDIRMVKAGEDVSACSTLNGVQVACKKSIGRKGDWCSIESPLFQKCTEHFLKNNASDADSGDLCGNNSTENEMRTGDGRNVLQFEGVIYGLPKATPGISFSLKTHVYLRVKDHLPRNITINKEPSMERVCSSVIVDDQNVRIGKILRRQLTKTRKGDSMLGHILYAKPKRSGKNVFSGVSSITSTSSPLHYHQKAVQREKLKRSVETRLSVEKRARRSIISFNSHKHILNNNDKKNHTNKYKRESTMGAKGSPFTFHIPEENFRGRKLRKRLRIL